MKLDTDRCRSLLFVPAGNKRFVNSAMKGHADVIQLDLEDAIAPSQKQAARESARMELETIDATGRVVSVRVNVDDSLLAADLEGVVHPGLSALTIPKVESSEMLAAIDQQVSRLESKRSMPSGEIQFIAQIESSKGILNVREIAHASPRLAALGIGMEDLIANVGGTVAPDALYFPAMQTLYAAREAGVTPIGYLGSITVYKDIKLFREWAIRAKSLGFDGGFCIHPNQVAILNDSFRPSPEEVDAAQGIVNAVEQYKEAGVGAFSHDGKMLDAPVVERARRVLRLHQSYSL